MPIYIGDTNLKPEGIQQVWLDNTLIYNLVTGPAITFVLQDEVTEVNIPVFQLYIAGSDEMYKPYNSHVVNLPAGSYKYMIFADNYTGLDRDIEQIDLETLSSEVKGDFIVTDNDATVEVPARSVYRIYNAKELQYLNTWAVDVTTYGDRMTDHDFYLMAAIDLLDYLDPAVDIGWTPVGSSSTPFTGRFNGEGNKVENIRIYKPAEDNVGLFGVLAYPGEIHNIRVSTDIIYDYVATNFSVVLTDKDGVPVGSGDTDAHVYMSGTDSYGRSLYFGGQHQFVYSGMFEDSTANVSVSAEKGYAPLITSREIFAGSSYQIDVKIETWNPLRLDDGTGIVKGLYKPSDYVKYAENLSSLTPDYNNSSFVAYNKGDGNKVGTAFLTGNDYLWVTGTDGGPQNRRYKIGADGTLTIDSQQDSGYAGKSGLMVDNGEIFAIVTQENSSYYNWNNVYVASPNNVRNQGDSSGGSAVNNGGCYVDESNYIHIWYNGGIERFVPNWTSGPTRSTRSVPQGRCDNAYWNPIVNKFICINANNGSIWYQGLDDVVSGLITAAQRPGLSGIASYHYISVRYDNHNLVYVGTDGHIYEIDCTDFSKISDKGTIDGFTYTNTNGIAVVILPGNFMLVGTNNNTPWSLFDDSYNKIGEIAKVSANVDAMLRSCVLPNGDIWFYGNWNATANSYILKNHGDWTDEPDRFMLSNHPTVFNNMCCYRN
jgi:hypothetical protein